MLQTINRDITMITTGVIAQQVNCQGVMGGGLAAQIRRKWPVVYQEYSELYKTGQLILGYCQIINVDVFDNLWVANLAGQYNFGRDPNIVYTNYIALKNALTKLKVWVDADNKATGETLPIYIPYQLGCGLGNGKWDTVNRIIEEVIPEAIICKIE